MKKISILTAISGALVAASLSLAGPASAHRGDAGDASGAPVGGTTHSATQSIGVGIFTNPASKVGAELPLAPIGAAPATAVHAPTFGAELPLAPIGAAPAA